MVNSCCVYIVGRDLLLMTTLKPYKLRYEENYLNLCSMNFSILITFILHDVVLDGENYKP